MNSTWAVLIMIFSSLLAAISQLMLKRSADIEHKNFWREYLNVRVIGAYAILFFTTLLNMVAMIALPLKVVTAVGTASYVFVIILSKMTLGEKIGPKKIAGMLLIIAGILIFSLLG